MIKVRRSADRGHASHGQEDVRLRSGADRQPAVGLRSGRDRADDDQLGTPRVSCGDPSSHRVAAPQLGRGEEDQLGVGEVGET